MGHDARAEIAAGVAQAFHNFMSNKLYELADDAAERAASSQSFLNRVSKARQSGDWVLVYANFAVSKYEDAGGTKSIAFRSVDMVQTGELEGESPDQVLRRLRGMVGRQPATMNYRWAGDTSSGRRDPYANENWQWVPKEMAVYPGEPPFEVVIEERKIGRFTDGRCVQRRLR
jgi:hypothetical protein